MFNPAQAYPANRHLSMEGIYEYGSRAGVWRILREFENARPAADGLRRRRWRCERHPELVEGLRRENGHEIASHGWRWIHYQGVHESIERHHMDLGMHVIQQLTGGQWPLGWYTGRDSPNTRRLVADLGGFEYDSDYYGDDLPFWLNVRQDRRRAGAASGRALHAGLQ